MSLTAREVLSHTALNWKLNELGKQKRSDREDLANKNEKPTNELEAGKETIVRLEGAVRGYEMSEGTKSGTAERVSSTGVEGSPKSSGSSEVRSRTRKRGKGKSKVCTLCCIVKWYEM